MDGYIDQWCVACMEYRGTDISVLSPRRERCECGETRVTEDDPRVTQSMRDRNLKLIAAQRASRGSRG